MARSLLYWCDLYDRLKSDAFCLDIETSGFNGVITVVGLYRPRDGPIQHEALINGDNLNQENLAWALSGCKLLITFNGLRFDLPRIRKEFPGAIPENIPVIDLYLFSQRLLGARANLKTVENTLLIDPENPRGKQRGFASKMWHRFKSYGDRYALDKLLAYNRQDTVRLYPLAKKLVAMARSGNSPRAVKYLD